jgi:hypothetical protein
VREYRGTDCGPHPRQQGEHRRPPSKASIHEVFDTLALLRLPEPGSASRPVTRRATVSSPAVRASRRSPGGARPSTPRASVSRVRRLRHSRTRMHDRPSRPRSAPDWNPPAALLSLDDVLAGPLLQRDSHPVHEHSPDIFGNGRNTQLPR